MSNANGIKGYTEQSNTTVDVVNRIKTECQRLAHNIRMMKYVYEDEGNAKLFSELERENLAEDVNCTCRNIIEYLDKLLDNIENPQQSQRIYYEITKLAMEDLRTFTDKFFKVNTPLKRDSNANLEYIRKIVDVEMWACRTAFNAQTPFDSRDIIKFFE